MPSVHGITRVATSDSGWGRVIRTTQCDMMNRGNVIRFHGGQNPETANEIRSENLVHTCANQFWSPAHVYIRYCMAGVVAPTQTSMQSSMLLSSPSLTFSLKNDAKSSPLPLLWHGDMHPCLNKVSSLLDTHVCTMCTYHHRIHMCAPIEVITSLITMWYNHKHHSVAVGLTPCG